MPVRIKKLIGTFLILIWLFFYCLFAMKLAVTVLPDSAWWIQLLYYAFAGIAWIVPPGFVIQWMSQARPGELNA